ncbi:MAG: U32 family peptidase [Sphaerochaetaceae bacterium]|nr:U32 family peptidase [Sphaerochaetaceae bacterium]
MTKTNGRPELALPAGSLQCALYAFDGGADAVYLGLKAFSARKHAVNFSFDDLRKLKQVCLVRNKKFYITLNTLVHDSEMPEIIKILRQLEYIAPDGLIVQDLGIASIIRRDFPALPLHASTQLAVHTAEGVKVLQKMGFSRVVLARETSLEEIKVIRKECPDIELKVFIHGALCYGFSGLCMASENITGRSANRGECAQICRTWFHCREMDEDLWPFSMKDLCVGPDVVKFAEAGVDSLKVEGRMKGSEYVYWTARYYSLLLDGADPFSEEVLSAEEAMKTAFSRETTKGFLNSGKKGSMGSEIMVCSTYPSHIGVQVGKLERVLNGKAVIRFSKPVALRDGLLVISGKESAGFALSDLSNGRSFVSAGEVVTVSFPSSSFTRKPQSGTPVMCTSRHNAQLPLLNENLPLYKQETDLHIVLTDGFISVNGRTWPLEIQEAKKLSDEKTVLRKIFEASDASLFTLGKLTVENNSSAQHPFMPLSSLKQIRREFYLALDEGFKASVNRDSYSVAGEMKYIKAPENSYVIPPVDFDEKALFASLTSRIPKVSAFGLTNVSHIAWAASHPEVPVFADQFLYVYNSEAFSLLKSLLPSLTGCVKTDPGTLPLFISRVCFRHHALKKDCKNCSRNNTYHISQNGNNYKVTCKDCITYVERS